MPECHTPDQTHDTTTTDPDQYAAGNYVRGSVHQWLLPNADGRWMVRILFWGNDDFGVERDEFYATESAAEEAYRRWLGWIGRLAYASHLDLLKLGFQPG